MKNKIISSVAALAAALLILTGCSTANSHDHNYGTTSSRYSTSHRPLVLRSSSDLQTSDIKSEVSIDSSPELSSTASSRYTNVSSSSERTYTRYSGSSSEAPVLTAPEQGAYYKERVLDTKSEEFVEYTTGNGELSFSQYYAPYLFNFKTSMSVGYSLNDTDNQLPVEADYGIRGEFDGSIAIVRTYDHTNRGLFVTKSYIEGLDESVDKKISYSFSETPKLCEMKNLPNGLYRISVTFSNYSTCELYYLVNGDEYQFCQMVMAGTSTIDPAHNINDIRKRRTHLSKLLNEWNVTPENSLDVSIIKYPQKDFFMNGRQVWRCDTEKWADLSDEIVNPSWSDERKAFAICDWLSQNIAYDKYVSDVLNEDRSQTAVDFMGKYSVWNLRAGVCRDFGQIFAIMCRRQGIPAEVIGNENHLWNIVYLNGKWLEVDLCISVSEYVKTADTTVHTNANHNYSGMLNMIPQNNFDYGTSLHKLLYMGQNFSD